MRWRHGTFETPGQVLGRQDEVMSRNYNMYKI